MGEEKTVIIMGLSGTLVNTEYCDNLVVKEVLGKFGVHTSKVFTGGSLITYLSSVTENERLRELLLDDFEKTSYDMLEKIPIKVNKELFDMIKSNTKRCVLLTSQKKKRVHAILEKIGLRDDFVLILTQEDVEEQKPHPEPYLKVLEGLNSNAEQCLAFENSDSGVQSATMAGITVERMLF